MVRNTQDSRESQGRPEAPVHLAGSFADPRILEGDLGAVEPARCKRGGWRDDQAVRERVGDPSPGHLCAPESRDLQGSTGSTRGNPEGSGQGRHETAGNTNGGGPAAAEGGRADPRSCIRGCFPQLLVRISTGT